MKLHGPLDNYIQMHRQRSGLSQEDVAFLVSITERGSVSRYEQGSRYPSLEILLALEMVLDQPIQKLFAGIAERVRENVSSRAGTLLQNMNDDVMDKRFAMKLEVLSKLSRPDDEVIIPVWEHDA